MSKVRYNYSSDEPGDGCLASIFIASIVMVLIFFCVYVVRGFMKAESEPTAPECPTHSCMYEQPLRSSNGTHY